jgi:hypothetical protein
VDVSAKLADSEPASFSVWKTETAAMADVWNSYRATVAYQGATQTIPVQAMSEHEVADHARIMAGFEFGWNPAEVQVLAYEPDTSGSLPNAHIHTFEVHVRPEGGDPEVLRLKARDIDTAEGLAALHCADRLGIDVREIDVLSAEQV